MPPVPESIATREDLAIFHTCTHGLSLNRNHAIAHSTAPLCLIADDDLHYNAGGLQAVIDTFSKHPETDIAAFSHTGGDNKYFPSYGFDMSRPQRLLPHIVRDCIPAQQRHRMRDKVQRIFSVWDATDSAAVRRTYGWPTVSAAD